MTVRVLRTTAQPIQYFQAETDELGAELATLVDAVAPWLVDLPGVGSSSSSSNTASSPASRSYEPLDRTWQLQRLFVSPSRDAGAAWRCFQQRSARQASRPPRSQPIGRRCARRCGGDAASGMAPHRAVRPQPGRVRSRPPEGTAAADARPQAGPQRQVIIARACLRPEREARPLRAGGRGASESAAGRRIRRTRHGDLIPAERGLQHARVGATQHRPRRSFSDRPIRLLRLRKRTWRPASARPEPGGDPPSRPAPLPPDRARRRHDEATAGTRPETRAAALVSRLDAIRRWMSCRE
jgi:hypothetical protein